MREAATALVVMKMLAMSFSPVRLHFCSFPIGAFIAMFLLSLHTFTSSGTEASYWAL
jgi:hypothetical protein